MKQLNLEAMNEQLVELGKSIADMQTANVVAMARIVTAITNLNLLINLPEVTTSTVKPSLPHEELIDKQVKRRKAALKSWATRRKMAKKKAKKA